MLASLPATTYFITSLAAADKEELLEMITHGAKKTINSSDEYVYSPSATCNMTDPVMYSLLVNDDIEEISQGRRMNDGAEQQVRGPQSRGFE